MILDTRFMTKEILMAEITAAAVKALREKTDLPMMECKKALTEAGGDEAKAMQILREMFKKFRRNALTMSLRKVVFLSLPNPMVPKLRWLKFSANLRRLQPAKSCKSLAKRWRNSSWQGLVQRMRRR